MFTGKQFWLDTLERAIKTFAQFLLASGVLDVASTDLQTTVQTKLLGAVMAAIISLVTSIASTRIGTSNTASVLPLEADTERGQVSSSLVVLVILALLIGFILGRIL